MAGNTEPLPYGATGATLYATARSRTSGEWWNGTAMAGYADGAWSSYGVAMPEIGTSGIYLFTAPAGLPADDYDFFVRLMAGGTPALSDGSVSALSDNWDGAVLLPLADAGGGGGGGGTIYGTSGTLTYTVTELDALALPIPDVEVWISQDEAGTMRTQSLATDDLGQARFRLDPQDAWLWRAKAGQSWDPNPKAIVIG